MEGGQWRAVNGGRSMEGGIGDDSSFTYPALGVSAVGGL